MAATAEQPKNNAPPLVIVGGGFAGTTALLHWLIRAADDPALSAQKPLNITMIERDAKQLHGGIAYGQTPQFSYNLNLTSKRISPFAKGDKPEGFPSFDDYLDNLSREHPEFATNYANPQRQLYGLYLDEMVHIALEKAGDKVHCETRINEVTDLTEEKDGATLTLKDGEKIKAAHVILATGLKDAVSPAFAFNVAASPDYLDYPYSKAANGFYDRLINGPKNTENNSTLIIGTGLTAMDGAIRLLESGYKGKITMVSRRGLIHPTYQVTEGQNPKDALKGEPRPESTLAFTQEKPAFIKTVENGGSFDDVFKSIESELKSRVKEGYSTEEVLSYWEKFVPQLYEKFPDETVDFLLDYETAINIMRVGTTPEIANKIHAAMESGQLDLVTGRVQQMSKDKTGFNVSIRPNDRNGQGIGPEETKHFDTVISGIGNSTKYDLAPDEMKDTFWRNMRRKDAFLVHGTRDGVAVTKDFSLKKADGSAYQHVSVTGAPVSGHMNVTAYPYPEKSGAGARLGAFTLNIQGILGAVLALADAKYAQTVKEQITPEAQAYRPKSTVRIGAAPRPA